MKDKGRLGTPLFLAGIVIAALVYIGFNYESIFSSGENGYSDSYVEESPNEGPGISITPVNPSGTDTPTNPSTEVTQPNREATPWQQSDPTIVIEPNPDQDPTQIYIPTPDTPSQPSTPTTIYVTKVSLSGCNNLIVGGNETITTSITPSNANDKSLQWFSSNTSIASVSSKGVVTGKSAGTVTITALNSTSGVKGTCSVKVSNPSSSTTPSTPTTPTIDPNRNAVDFYYLNTQTGQAGGDEDEDSENDNNDDQDESVYSVNEAIIIRTKDDKYVMIDTASNDANILNSIYNKLKSLQNTNTVTIDYLIISHMHPDHFGNAISMMQNSKFNIKNLYIKDESNSSYNYYKKNYNAIKTAAESAHINILTKDYKGLYDFELPIGSNYVSLHIYNNKDLFTNMTCHKGYIGMRFTADASDPKIKKYPATDGNSYYFYVSGSEYIKCLNGQTSYCRMKKTSELTANSSNTGTARRFYLRLITGRKNCNANANSLSVLVKVNTNSGYKYIYVSNDIENSGYSIFPDSNNISSSSKFSRVYGNFVGSTKPSKSSLKFNLSTGDFEPLSNDNFYSASESIAANKVKSHVNSVNNIVIYAQSHHGLNNAPDAMKTLGLNRPDVYSIFSVKTDPSASDNFLLTRSYYMTLNNTIKLRTSASNNGVYCYIKSDATYKCINN